MYDVAVTAMLAGTLDLVADPILVAAHDQGTPFQSDALTWSDVPAPIAGMAHQPLIDRQAYRRALLASDLTFPTLPENRVLGVLVLYRETDEMVIAYLDTRPDRMLLAVAGNAGPVTVAWAGGTVLSL
jgi:hypothetical protein